MSGANIARWMLRCGYTGWDTFSDTTSNSVVNYAARTKGFQSVLRNDVNCCFAWKKLTPRARLTFSVFFFIAQDTRW